MAKLKPNPLRHGGQKAGNDAPRAATDAAAASPTCTSFAAPAPGRSPSGAHGSAGAPEPPPPLVTAGSVGCCAAVGGLSFALLNLCSFFKGVDDSVLPAVFLEVGSTLGIGPQALGTLGMIGAFTIGLASPPAGWLGTRYSRPHLIGYGCLTWSIGAVGLGAAQTYPMLATARAINGVGLGMIGPLMYGMVVDSWEPHQRGKALGVLGITGSIGGLVGGWFATTVGSLTVLGFAG